MKFATFAALLALVLAPLAAQEADEAPNLLDLLPGYWHFTHGDPVLGTLAATGTVANLAPLFVPAADSGPTEYWVEKGGLHYFAWSDPSAAGRDTWRPVRAGVGMAGIWGGFFSVYAAWDRTVKIDTNGRRARWQNLTMADYLVAPFQPENVFNFDVMPLFPMLQLYPITTADWGAVGRYFRRDSVDFLGSRVSPAAGLAMTTVGALVLVAANATQEEIAYRGAGLDTYGVIGSSVLFGANHLINPFALPNFSFEEAAQQTAFATLFGLYAADRTQARGGDFRRMIALHYWHNVTTLVLGYLIDPEHAQLFMITIPL